MKIQMRFSSPESRGENFSSTFFRRRGIARDRESPVLTFTSMISDTLDLLWPK